MSFLAVNCIAVQLHYYQLLSFCVTFHQSHPAASKKWSKAESRRRVVAAQTAFGLCSRFFPALARSPDVHTHGRLQRAKNARKTASCLRLVSTLHDTYRLSYRCTGDHATSTLHHLTFLSFLRHRVADLKFLQDSQIFPVR